MNIFNRWYQNYRQASVLSQLQRELFTLVHGQKDTAQRLINLEKIKHPGHSQSWYLDKVIYDLRRSA
ncbi:hypothetical protein [Myxosarcina sp. GI1]|uniref:hypothetical protein n=1 Tax=Myxosarcina sp. GI1 TaxID=1541065 RepID=UPI00055BF131|nr:hypothetical protein [Myxosarcina sp. GI1]